MAAAFKKPSYSKAQIATAVAAVKALDGDPDDDTKVPAFWDMCDDMPDISQIDFGDAGQVNVVLKDLMASTKRLNRAKLLWHVQHPGQAMRTNPFTTEPIVGAINDGAFVVIDGHHRLAAQMLLGATQYPVWSVPVKN